MQAKPNLAQSILITPCPIATAHPHGEPLMGYWRPGFNRNPALSAAIPIAY